MRYGAALMMGPALAVLLTSDLSARGQELLPATGEVAASAPAQVEMTGRYRLSGDKALRPARIGDDGVHIYIVWDAEQSLPAVFAINALGEEEMVDGYMRSGVFTIDRVYDRLVFRMGRKIARATRQARPGGAG